MKFHSIREAEKNLLIKLHYCPTDVQLADIMTKALPRSRLKISKYETWFVQGKSQGGVLEL